MSREADEELRVRIRAASNTATGLDMDVLRKKRDAMLKPNTNAALSVDAVTSWQSRLAAYDTRRMSVNDAEAPLQIRRLRPYGTATRPPDERVTTTINTASNRRNSSDD